MLFNRHHIEAEFKTLAAINLKLRKNIGAAACGSRASCEAVNINGNRVFIVEILLMLCVLKKLLRKFSDIEIEIVIIKAESESAAVFVGYCKVTNLGSVA